MKNILFIALICVFSYIQLSVSLENGCQKCLQNDIYCENDKNYYYCLNGQKLPGNFSTCPTGTVCSSDKNVCVSPTLANNGNIAVCSPNDASTCAANGTCAFPYICLGANIYARCNNGVVATNGIFRCAGDEYCSDDIFRNKGQKSICAPKCALDFFGYKPSCQLYQLESLCWEAVGRGHKETSFYIPSEYDDTCTHFIGCTRKGNVMNAATKQCQGGYFNPSAMQCQYSYVCPKK